MKPEYNSKPPRDRGTISRWNRQRGALTIFTGVFVLILMTLMLMYATRVGVFEQRVSSNEMRQKQAFHAAEAALQQAIEYLQANQALVDSSDEEAGPDGEGGFDPGWFFDDADPTTPRWQKCSDVTQEILEAGHPCGLASNSEMEALAGSFYFDIDDDLATIETLPWITGAMAANTTARATATVCVLEIAEDKTITCDDTGNGGIILITLMGYGYSDCPDVDASGVIENDEISLCTGAATVSIPITSLTSLAGAGGMPLVTKNALPVTGSAEVVGNPNAGGIGVPVTVWANDRPNVSGGCPPLDSDGAIATTLQGNQLGYL
jgi:hypothetical protein